MKHRPVLISTVLLVLFSLIYLPRASAAEGMETQAVSRSSQPLLAVQGETAADWIKRNAEGPPSPRTGAAMVYDIARGVTVLFGGSGDHGNLNDTWEWDGTEWIRHSPPNSPPRRL